MPPPTPQRLTPSRTNGTANLAPGPAPVAPSALNQTTRFDPPRAEGTIAAFRQYPGQRTVSAAVAVQIWREYRQRLAFARTSQESAQRMQFAGEKHEMGKTEHKAKAKQSRATYEKTLLDIQAKTRALDKEKASSATEGLEHAKNAFTLMADTVAAFRAAKGMYESSEGSVPQELFKEYGVAYARGMRALQEELNKLDIDPFPQPANPIGGGGQQQAAGSQPPQATAPPAAPPAAAQQPQPQPFSMQQAGPGTPVPAPRQPGGNGLARSRFTTREGHTYEQREDGKWHLVE